MGSTPAAAKVLRGRSSGRRRRSLRRAVAVGRGDAAQKGSCRTFLSPSASSPLLLSSSPSSTSGDDTHGEAEILGAESSSVVAGSRVCSAYYGRGCGVVLDLAGACVC